MANRREFLQAAAAATAAPAVAQAARATGLSGGQIDLHAIVVDGRFEAARRFGGLMAERGRRVHVIDADITDLWQAELRPLWAQAPAAIAGVTERPALFCLEQLALDHRMRVVYHAEHVPTAAGCAHELIVGGARVSATDFDDAGAYWPAVFAHLLDGARAQAPTAPTAAGLARSLDEPAGTLVSWIIAPVAKG